MQCRGEEAGVDDGRRQIAERTRQVDVAVDGGLEIGLVVAETEAEVCVAGSAAGRRTTGGGPRATLAVGGAPAGDGERRHLELETARRRHLQQSVVDRSII